MKELNVNNRIFQYQMFVDINGFITTHFYEGTETITRKKYWLFGPYITKEVPHEVFTLNFSIEDDNYTKSEIQRRLESKIEILDRKKEIERGEII